MPQTLPERWSDLHQNLERDPQGSVRKVIDIDAVYTSIDNILGTFLGERVMLPEFGCTLRLLLFETMDPNFSLRVSNEIKNLIQRWEPRVKVTVVTVQVDPDNTFINIVVRFTVLGFGDIYVYQQRVP